MKNNRREADSFKEKYKGLNATQEVLYTNEFRRADKAAERQEHKSNEPNYRM